ncbi:amino acid permease [Haloarcula onubensis]|uniref:Amino acid permease n=1 Tax=Haloarcula onubensis TaxID=2950539 RepID=A0ABU2FPM3_9EURY|nr:amino acid permease [Halomicroarcula sp. S3CR25-11]MDS0282705.1 amino acid permease [Halomicroarcula sp. S3CR25-11]
MASDAETGADFARELTLLDVTFIGIGAMIGGSIFVLSGLAAGESGPALVLAFALNGFITIFTGMVYAELGSAIPEPGGGYLWVRTALGRSQAFLSGWMSWFAHAVAGSLYILSFGSFVTLILTEYFGLTLGLSDTQLQQGFALLAVALFTYINYRGAKETSRAENLVTALQLLIIAAFVVAGVAAMVHQPQVTAANFEPFFPNGAGGVFLAMGLTFIAFEGYEIIVQSGREVVNPRENIPKAVFYSMFVVVTIYVLVGAVLIGGVELTPDLLETARTTDSIGGSTVEALPPAPTVWEVLGHLGEFGLAQAAGQFLPFGTLVILVTGILSSLAALNATTFSSSRVGYAMGRDSVFPDAFERIHPDHQTPHVSIVLSGALIAVMAVSLPLAQVAAATDLMFLLLFLQVNYSMIRIRREHGEDLDYGYIAPYFPYVPIVGILTKLFLAVYFFNYSPLAWLLAVGWILAGLVVFLVYSQGRIRRTELAAEVRVLSEERSAAGRPNQILVPIANPETAHRLLELASTLARQTDSELLVTTVVTIPVQTPLEEGESYVRDERDWLDEALATVPADVPAHRTVTIGRTAGRSIVSLAQQYDSDQVVLGWRGQRRRREYVLGSTIDYVVDEAPCDVVVAKSSGTEHPRRVLVPTDGGPHSERAEDIAGTFVGAVDGELTLLTVGLDGPIGQPYLDSRQSMLERRGMTVATELLDDADIVDAILRYAGEHEADTIVMGATRQGLLGRALFGDVPETVGERFDGEVLLVKQYRPTRSLVRAWLRRWLGERRVSSSSE